MRKMYFHTQKLLLIKIHLLIRDEGNNKAKLTSF